MKKNVTAIIATISLTFTGLVVGVAPANAVYNTDSAVQNQSILRTGSPAIVGNDVVASVTTRASEILTGYRSFTQFASDANPLIISVGAAQTFTTASINSSTQASAGSSAGSRTTIYWTKVNTTTETRWDSGMNAVGDLPTGDFKSYRVYRESYLNASVAGTYQTTSSFSVGGNAVAPIAVLGAADIGAPYSFLEPGFSIYWSGGISFTPAGNEASFSVSSTACIWPGELGIAQNTVINISYDNLDVANNSFATNNSVMVDASSGMNNYWNGTESETSEVTSVTLSDVSFSAIRINAYAAVLNPTANAIQPVFKAWLASDNTQTNILDACQKYESFAAPTLTTIDASSATLSWTAPATTHSSTFDTVSVYACSTAITSSCGEVGSLFGPGSARPYDFRYRSAITGTSVTINAANMMSLGGFQGGPAPWSPTADYRYFVYYEKSMEQSGYKGRSVLTAATTAGGVSSSSSTPSTPSSSSPSVYVPSNEVVLSGFAGHSVATPGQRKFSIDASGLTGVPEVLLNGKKLGYTRDANGKLAIDLPKNLKRGASYDLVVTSPEGSVTVLGAIALSANLPISKKSLPAFKAGTASLTATQVREIRSLVGASEFGDTVTCTAYVSGGTTTAIAKARATSACAAATAVNPDLKTAIRTAPAIASVRNTVRVVIG